MSGDSLNLDDFVPQEWPEEVKGLEEWAQGDLIGPLPCAWTAPPGPDPVTGMDTSAEGEGLLTVSPEEGFDWGIIVSQTCDVVSTGPGRRHPFAQVSPVYVTRQGDERSWGALRGWGVVDRVLLHPAASVLTHMLGADRQKDTILVADLRISLPVSKAVLAGRAPLHAFSEESDLLRFAEHLALKVERPALHGFVTDRLRSVIHDAIRGDARTNTFWWDSVDEVRVRCAPTRLHPREVEVIVVHRGDGHPDPAAVDRWNQLVRSLRREARRNLNISLRTPLHVSRHALLAETYRQSTRLHIPELLGRVDKW